MSVKLSSIGSKTLFYTRLFPSPGFFPSSLNALPTSIQGNLITEHNSPQWVGHCNQTCPFSFLQYHWSVFNMQTNSTHRAVPPCLSTSHSLQSTQCASGLCHKHEVQIPSHGHWPGSWHDCFTRVICSVRNGSEHPPSVQQHQGTRRGQIT